MSEKHPADCTGPFADGKLCPVHGRMGTTVCVDVSVKQPEEVKCIICEKLEPRRHPGHFMCGHPLCRKKIVELVRSSDDTQAQVCSLTRLASRLLKYIDDANKDGHACIVVSEDDASQVEEAVYRLASVLDRQPIVCK